MIGSHGSFGRSADMWSIGVIAFMLLFGRPPFHASTPDVTLDLIKLGQYSFPEPSTTPVDAENT